jgi:predicted RNA-binding Zn ribbon-like protein
VPELPAPLAPVLAFVNSMDVELSTDEWADGPPALAAWLVGAGLADPATRIGAADLTLAIDLRTGLRALTLANNGVPAPPAVVAAFTRALARVPLTATPTGLTAAPPFGAVVAGYAHGVATGDFARLRQCPAGDCSWVFWDSSAKGARKWCTMGVCGNRSKARAYAARQRA